MPPGPPLHPDLTRRDGRFLDLLAELAAPVQHTTKDAIVGEELKQHRRTVRTVTAAATLLFLLAVAAIIGAVVALDQRDQAEHRRQQALSQSLAGQAAELATSRPDLGILLAVEAWNHANTPQAEQALITAAQSEGLLPRVLSRSTPARAVAYQSGDRSFAILRDDGTVDTWKEGSTTAPHPTGLRAPQLQVLLTTGSKVHGLSSAGTVYELDEALGTITGEWSLSSGPRWTAVGTQDSGELLAVGDERGQLRLWSSTAHQPIGPPVAAHGAGVNAAAISADGQTVASVGNDNQLATWRVGDTGLTPLGRIALPATGAALQFLGDGRSLAVGEWNGAVQLFDGTTLAPRSDFGANGTQQLALAPITQLIPIDDGGFATVAMDGWIKRLSGTTFGVISSRRPAEGTPLAAAIDPVSGTTFVGSADGTTAVIVADAPFSSAFGKELVNRSTYVAFGTSTVANRLPLVEAQPVSLVELNPPTVVSLHAVDGRGRFDLQDVTRTPPLESVAGAVALGGNDVAVLDANAMVRRYRGTKLLTTLDIGGTRGAVRPVLKAINRDRIAAVLGNALVIVDTSGATLKIARTIDAPNGTTFSAVAPFSDRHRVIASMGDKSLYVFSTDTGADLRHIANGGLSSSIAVSPDDSLVAQVDALTGVVTIRDATTLRPLGRNLVAPGFVTDLTWLDGGRRLATASTDSTVHYWDIAERKQLAALPHGKKVEGVVAPRDGSTVYSAGLGLVREWNLSPARAARAACAEAGRNLTRDEWDTYLRGESYRPTCATTGGKG